MQEKLDKIADSIVRMESNLSQHIKSDDHTLGSLAVNVAKIEVNLKEHMRRTALLESRVKPLEEVVISIKGFLKFLAILGTIATIAKAASIWLQ